MSIFVGFQHSAVSIQPFLAAELVVLQVEDVLVEGLLAARSVLLGLEGSGVCLDGREVLHAGMRGSRGGRQTLLEFQLVRRERVRIARYLLAQEEAVTLVVGGRCRTVGCQQHLVAGVTAALARLCQCAGYGVDTGRENYICHFACGVCRTALALALALAVRTSTP